MVRPLLLLFCLLLAAAAFKWERYKEDAKNFICPHEHFLVTGDDKKTPYYESCYEKAARIPSTRNFFLITKGGPDTGSKRPIFRGTLPLDQKIGVPWREWTPITETVEGWGLGLTGVT